LGYKLVNACIMLARFAGTSHNLSRIQVYASMTDSTKELISFYKDLDECIQDIPRKDILMLTGDWNAEVGSINDGWKATMGKYGHGKHNDRGEAILEYALDNDMVICNTLFQQKECRKWTQWSPNQHTTNM